jgi:hypothetical protein
MICSSVKRDPFISASCSGGLYSISEEFQGLRSVDQAAALDGTAVGQGLLQGVQHEGVNAARIISKSAEVKFPSSAGQAGAPA